LIKRFNEGGPDLQGDQRANIGTEPTILTPEALEALGERLKSSPDDGGQWTAAKIARWLAGFHSHCRCRLRCMKLSPRRRRVD